MDNIIAIRQALNEPKNELELMLVAHVLNRPKSLDAVRMIVDSDILQSETAKTIYTLICEYAARGITIDMKTVRSSANVDQETMEFLNCYIPAGDVVSMAKLVREDSYNRKIEAVAASPSEPMEKARLIAELYGKSAVDQTAEFMRAVDIIDQVNTDIEDVHRAGGYTGLSTGLTELDKALSGLDAGGMYVLAGRPSMGKTALGLSIACHVAERHPVAFFSLEMSNKQLGQRLNARYSKTPIWNQKNGQNIDFNALTEGRKRIEGLNLAVFERGGVTADYIAAKARDEARRNPPALIIIDHLGIVAARDARVNRVNAVGEMTATFKALAKELKCPLLLLHQLNRGVEGRDDKRPSLSDLRDSGSVEQDADAVIMIYREEYYLSRSVPKEGKELDYYRKLEDAKGKAELLIMKNRQGECRTVMSKFDPIRQVFEDAP